MPGAQDNNNIHSCLLVPPTALLTSHETETSTKATTMGNTKSSSPRLREQDQLRELPAPLARDQSVFTVSHLGKLLYINTVLLYSGRLVL